MRVYLVDLVCSTVFANSDSECGFIGHGYSQLHIWHAVIVLAHDRERQTVEWVTDRQTGWGLQKQAQIWFFYFTSSDSDRNSCMMSLSPITRTEHTADKTHIMFHEDFLCLWNKCSYSNIICVFTIFLPDHSTLFPLLLCFSNPRNYDTDQYILENFSTTFLQVFFKASASCIQLLLRQGKRPFPRQLGECKVGKLPLKVLV